MQILYSGRQAARKHRIISHSLELTNSYKMQPVLENWIYIL